MNIVSHSPSSLFIHQALFGYASGHSLIESSRNLSKSNLRRSLILSDLSGPSVVDGFYEYLTGFPLADDEIYVFSKTWYAPEMQRPGCVWTHCLLLDFQQLRSLPDLISLKSLFRRPNERNSFDFYSKVIDLESYEVSGNSDQIFSYDLSGKVISSLYGIQAPIFIIADNSDLYEDLILSIWNQQWPELRRNFSFCTGSLSLRRLSKQDSSFNLQVIPSKIISSIQRESKNGQFIDPKQDVEDSKRDSWTETIISDLNGENNFRQFCWKYASDVRVSLQMARIFAEIYSAIIVQSNTESLSPRSIVQRVALSLPDVSEAKCLKADLFGALHDRRFLFWLEEIELLHELSKDDVADAFDVESLRIADRGYKLWRKNGYSEIRKIRSVVNVDVNINNIDKALIWGFAEAISTDDIKLLIETDRDLLSNLVLQKPEIATYDQYWHCPQEFQRKTIEMLREDERLSIEILKEDERFTLQTKKKIVESILSQEADGAVEAVEEWVGKAFVGWVVDWYSYSNQNTSERFLQHLGGVLSRHPSELIIRLSKENKIPIKIANTLIASIDIDSYSFSGTDLEMLLALVDRSVDYTSKYEAKYILSIGLALGFEKSDLLLIVHTFPQVYDLAYHNDLDNTSWRQLRSRLPDKANSWDWCEHLRTSLMYKFIEMQWPVGKFVECIKAPGIEKALSDRWKYSFNREIREFISKVKDYKD